MRLLVSHREAVHATCRETVTFLNVRYHLQFPVRGDGNVKDTISRKKTIGKRQNFTLNVLNNIPYFQGETSSQRSTKGKSY